MPAPEELSREELIELAGCQAARIAAQDAQITAMAGQLAGLAEVNEALAGKLAKLEHLLSRNSGNSSSPPSKDDEAGKTPPEPKRRRVGPARPKGGQKGAPGTNLAWSDAPDDQRDRFPQGRCECGGELAGATDLGIVDAYQQIEIPLVAAKLTQYDQHAVRCGCGKVHTAPRPEGARDGKIGYGPNLQAWAVFLMVVHFVPVRRCADILESLTGAAPSAGFVHSMLERAAGLVEQANLRIRALITLAYAVCLDETPLKVGSTTPRKGKKKAERYLLVACTRLLTLYHLGDRSLDTFKAFVFQDLTGSVIVHDRYQNYDSAELGEHLHQLCTAHLLRDLDDAGEVYPEQTWPDQIADALRGLIHEANLAREHSVGQIEQTTRDKLIKVFRHGVLDGLKQTLSPGNRPGMRKARLLLQVLHEREADVLRFARDLNVPPTSNQAERDLRPSKVQQNISGRLPSEDRTKDRYAIRGYVSTAVKHGLNAMTVLREAFLGRPWLPELPAPT